METNHRDPRRWLRRPAAQTGASIRLICLPHAGGAASSFRPWQHLLQPEIEPVTMQYPGREDRFGDRLIDTMDVLVAEIVDVLETMLTQPYALFGHSMGSAVAYEIAVEARRRGLRAPVRLIASGRPSPHHAVISDVHRQDDASLAAELVRLGGTPREVMADDELRAAVLRYVRNDYRLIETYRPSVVEPLSCPVSVLIGSGDPECGEPAATTWRSTTSEAVSVVVFEGDHFFLVPQRSRVAAVIGRELGFAEARDTRTWPSTP
ncbi:thioesterase II family protein [Actinoalloteichus hymeniacidonis]|uniref:Oleoyl-(Acyl-carrier-protein) hydrolase n=1 Tax=Actinoalloteichus hymeniacidonis TaxID=340345 RepID=A0AAC9HRM5_9PSEU|nr:alpha/beta fold hydrolase [Actinoalloteichus hymeniacidonis]AOS63696.1 Oleoyl-(acyl-carrier-protein) hydrolase [Actinoalloteichus hymeniacidonis]MBB5908251.1 surfactin synthase thioesterase subunit [Actinoalloteichus hymeniacidonis]